VLPTSDLSTSFGHVHDVTHATGRVKILEAGKHGASPDTVDATVPSTEVVSKQVSCPLVFF
jgi:hypothetical protein